MDSIPYFRTRISTKIFIRMNYTKLNNLFGWLCFAIASFTYIITAEPTASFWDCGEFIAAAYKLQVVHQPGAPLFLMVQKVFSLLAGADQTKVAFWMNVGSALSSAATILFLFWTITALARKILWKEGETLTSARLITILGSGLVGALAYTYSDTFWFSAVESEVYAMSSLCTAIVFWAILKWDAHADEPYADKWLVFIAYIMGLSIGVHLLNLLVIPAMALVYYFRRYRNPTGKGTLIALFTGIIILAIIQYGIIQYLIKGAAYFDLFFVNTLGMGFGSGVFVFLILIIAAVTYGIIYSVRKAKPVLNIAMLCLAFILLGYSSFAMIMIRAKANTTLNNSDPDNAFALLSYLNREQYGDRPLLYGQYFDSKPVDYKQGGNIYRKGDKKYEVAGKKYSTVYDRNTLLPRMYSTDPQHAAYYRDWMKLGESDSPNFIQNLGFLFSYQTGFMYARYFLWNFAGRQNDDQGHGNYTSGNWISGIKPLDALRLGPQDNLPPSITENKAYNRLFFLPLILGLLGAVWHFKRSQKDAGVVGLLFFFTGVAIVLYLNQNPLQPRERDYAFAGSFYAYAIWIGLGVAAIASWLQKKLSAKTAGLIATAAGLLAAPVLMAAQEWDDHDRSGKYTTRDFAANYLESCAPNAILFTYGDNDTYPLWYAQEVENIRPDVRIVNLSLLGTDWYIRQMKDKVNQSAPLPITMDNKKFAQGVRDVIRYYDYGLPDAVELKTLFEVLTSDQEDDKVPMQDGSRENILPTKKFKITIDPQQIIKNNVVNSSMRDRLAPAIEWNFNQNYLTKDGLAMIDILAHNNWKRPVYFAVTVPQSNYMGLDKYLYNEGFAYRLLPLKPDTTDSAQRGPGGVNSEAMYTNLMSKLRWKNLKELKYVDPHTTSMISTSMRSFNVLAADLYKDGKIEEARKVINKSLEVIPEQNYLLYYALERLYTTDMLYKVNETEKANKLAKRTADYLNKEMAYVAGLSEGRKNFAGGDVQLALSVMNELVRLTEEHKQTAVHDAINKQFTNLRNQFM